MVDASIPQLLLALGSGSLIGCSLGLIGGGGSILATPLLVYVVGLRDVHTAIGTGALLFRPAPISIWLVMQHEDMSGGVAQQSLRSPAVLAPISVQASAR